MHRRAPRAEPRHHRAPLRVGPRERQRLRVRRPGERPGRRRVGRRRLRRLVAPRAARREPPRRRHRAGVHERRRVRPPHLPRLVDHPLQSTIRRSSSSITRSPTRNPPIRLETFATAGEQFTAVGWGVTSSTQTPTTRQQRTGLAVSAVGPTNDGALEIAAAKNEFSVGEATCEGDSGGPAISATTGAIIGTVSRGGNGTSSQNIAATCTGAGTANLYTQPAGFKDVIEQAAQAAGATIWEEGSRTRTSRPSGSRAARTATASRTSASRCRARRARGARRSAPARARARAATRARTIRRRARASASWVAARPAAPTRRRRRRRAAAPSRPARAAKAAGT